MVIELVNRYRDEYGIYEGCDPRNACTRLSLNMLFIRMDEPLDGSFSYEKRSITINQGRKNWSVRYLFTAYHEIMHILLEDDGELIELLHDSCGDDDQLFRNLKEYACNVGAAEFIAPQQSVRRTIEKRGFSVDLINYMNSIFKLSLAAASIHLGRCSPTPCYVVVGRYGPSRLRRQHAICLHVEYASAPHFVEKPLIAGTPIPEDHLFSRVWHKGGNELDESYIPFWCGEYKPCVAEAKRIKDRIYGVLSWDA
jgi:hypothetical protein